MTDRTEGNSLQRAIPELLAPAGSEAAFIAAVENGADAIYLGGRAFNARMHAGNFDDRMMQQVLDYAHKRGVLVFVTMNTLLTDDELPEALHYAAWLREAGADALIIQDLGLGSALRQNFPDLPLHLSTQATICDLPSVQTARDLGYERVVLARELSLPEIRMICSAGIADIEVFLHGALCICYSGQCQMSRYYGGRSGNRGDCAQPCRLPYSAYGAGSRKEGRYPLSPRDLCLIDSIGELAEAGVRSLKIEGRMKSPEYVAVVTGIYRKALDRYAETGSAQITEEDREALLQIYNRGRFTDAYLHGMPGRKLMSGDIPKNQGVEAGTVTRTKKGSALIDVKLRRPLATGDGVEIHPSGGSREPVSNILTYRKELPDGTVRIGDFRGSVSPGDRVFRTSSHSQIENARRSFREMSLEADAAWSEETEHSETGDRVLPARKCLRQQPATITVLAENGMLTVTAATEGADGSWDSLRPKAYTCTGGPYERNPEQAASPARYESAFRKSGGTPFAITDVRLEGTADLKVPASELNRLRREALRGLERACCFRREPLPVQPDSAGMPGAESRAELLFYTLERWKSERVPAETRVLLPLAEICLEAEERGQTVREWLSASSGEIIPYVSNVTKGLEDQILERHLEELPDALRGREVCAGNFIWLRRLAAAGGHVSADYGFNTYNRKTAEVLRRTGAARVYPGLEEAVQQQGAYPLMVSEYAFPAELYRGDRGRSVRVVRRRYSSQTLLVPDIHTAAGKAPSDARYYMV